MTVRAAVWPPAIELGLKAAVAPTGSPVTLSDALPENPSNALRLTAYPTLPPVAKTWVAGPAVSA